MAQWTEDPRTEEKLRNLGVSFQCRKIPLAELKIKESRTNNARLGQATDDDVVERYALAMESGKKFPAIVCTASGFILDGNHRTAAAELTDADFALAYVVLNADKTTRDIIVRTFNAEHGVPLSKTERIQQAVQLVVTDGCSISDAATAESVKYDDVKDGVDVFQVRGVLEDAGLRSSDLHKSAVLKLKKLSGDPPRMYACAELAIAEKLTVAEVEDLVDKVARKRRAEAKDEIISDWRSKLIRRKNTGAPHPNRIKIFRHIQSLSKFLQEGNRGDSFASLSEMGVKLEDDRLTLQREWREVRKTLDSLFSEARKQAKK